MSNPYDISEQNVQRLGNILNHIMEVAKKDRGSDTALSDIIKDNGQRRVVNQLSNHFKGKESMQIDESEAVNLISAVRTITKNVHGQTTSRSMRSRRKQFEDELKNCGIPIDTDGSYTGRSYGAQR